MLIPHRAIDGTRRARYVAFPMEAFEQGVLMCLKEVRLGPAKNFAVERARVLAARVAHADARLAKLKAKVAANPSDALMDALVAVEAEKRGLATQLEEANREAATTAGEALGECQSLIGCEDRVRLRQAVKNAV
jgi:hypothetical protein